MKTLTKPIHELANTRFGTIPYEDFDVLDFPEGLIGFGDWHHFLIINHKEGSPFRWLQSIEHPSFAMLMVDPHFYDSSYDPRVPATELDRVQLGAGDPRLMYVTVSIPAGIPNDMTLNMAGPILINPANQLAVQVILPAESYNTRQRAFPESGDNQGEHAA